MCVCVSVCSVCGCRLVCVFVCRSVLCVWLRSCVCVCVSVYSECVLLCLSCVCEFVFTFVCVHAVCVVVCVLCLCSCVVFAFVSVEKLHRLKLMIRGIWGHVVLNLLSNIKMAKIPRNHDLVVLDLLSNCKWVNSRVVVCYDKKFMIRGIGNVLCSTESWIL